MSWSEMRAACLVWSEVRSVARLAMPRFTPPSWYECDVAVVLKGSGFWHEYEIKLSLADFRADRRKTAKHRFLAQDLPMLGPNRFWYVVPEVLAETVLAELPPWAGLVALHEPDAAHRWRRLSRLRRAPLRHRIPTPERLIERAETAAMYRMWAALDRLHGVGHDDLWASPEASVEPIEASS